MLNMHPDVLCTGELLWLDDALQKNLPCSCGKTIHDCSFWSSHIPTFPKSILADYRTTQREVFDELRKREGKQLILDLSKSRVYRHRRSWGWEDSGFIFVMRDPRGVLASRLREGGDFEHELARHRKWERRFERLTRRMGPRATLIHYEDLIAQPETILRDICAFMGIEFIPPMLSPADKDHHFLHSSVSPYLKGSNALSQDERWRRELATAQIDRLNWKLRRFRLYQERYLSR
jgi:hypothetical protein